MVSFYNTDKKIWFIQHCCCGFGAGPGPKLVCHFIPVCSDLSTESPCVPQGRGKAACRSALIYLLTLLGLFPNSDCLDYFKRAFKNRSLDPFLLWASVSSAIDEIGGLENYVL